MRGLFNEHSCIRNSILLYLSNKGAFMAIELRKCVICGAEYYGSKNKITCSGKCRAQKFRNERKILAHNNDRESKEVGA